MKKVVKKKLVVSVEKLRKLDDAQAAHVPGGMAYNTDTGTRTELSYCTKCAG